jgi:uncharacterized protein (TIGR02453 family)
MLKASTLKYLKGLKKNNNKPWFDANRNAYDEAREDLVALTGEIIKAISIFDPSISDLHPKDCLFRINRDIRFSKDKTPYKTNLASYFNKAGKKGNGAGYYLHIEPGQSFAAGGIWQPAPEDLAKVRQEIDYSFDEWKKMMNSSSFKKNFPTGFADNEILSRAPKGYDDNNPAIQFIKQKSFVVSQPISDLQLQSKTLVKDLSKIYQAMYPLIEFINKAID